MKMLTNTKRKPRSLRRRPLTVELLEGRRLLATIPLVSGDGYSVGVDDSDKFAVLQLEQTEYDAFLQDVEFRPNTQRIYEAFEDSFDFIVFLANETEVKSPYYGLAGRAQNDIAGIGRSIFDATANYGSDGRLKSPFYLAYRNALQNGPALHEIMHLWANSLPEFSQNSHWGFSNIGGQLGGWEPGTLRDLGNGLYQADGPDGDSTFSTFANGGNGIPYSEFELYLMGLIEAEDVSHEIKIARDAEYVSYGEGTFTASAIDTYTMQELIGNNGRRSPGPDSSQRDFRALTVLVTPEEIGPQVAEDLASSVEKFSRQGDDEIGYLYNFWEATEGRATIQMDGITSAIKIPTTEEVDGYDVNRDGVISNLDALVIINNLAIYRSTDSADSILSDQASRYDVNEDGKVSALDALTVINHIGLQHGTPRQSESTEVAEANESESDAFHPLSHDSHDHDHDHDSHSLADFAIESLF